MKNEGKRIKIFAAYRAVLQKCEFSIEMRDAVSQPSLGIEESYFSKSSLFFGKKSLPILLPEALNPLNPSNSRI